MKVFGSKLHISKPSSTNMGAAAARQGCRATFAVNVREPGTSVLALSGRF